MPRLPLLPRSATLLLLTVFVSACTVTYKRVDDTRSLPRTKVRPGISVLFRDSADLIRGKKIGLLANEAAVDEKGKTDIALFTSDPRMTSLEARLVALFAPEHGVSAKEDRTNLPSSRDETSGLPTYSLYGTQTMAPPDSALRDLDVLVIDLPDVGARTWTHVGAMVYAMRAAAKAGKPVVVLDRPNPLTGAIVEGPILDSSLANPDDPSPGKPGRAYALYPIPLRHGMTLGELARFYNEELKINATLTVVPVQAWRREIWFDLTGLPFVAPSPNLPSFKSVLLYTALVPFESTNLSVGRGTETPFQLIGAPWLNADSVVALVRAQKLHGVRFTTQRFTPFAPGDGKYNGESVSGIFIEVTSRSEVNMARVTATLLSAIHKVHGSQLEIRLPDFDYRFGSPQVREAILKGGNPDTVIDQLYGPVYAFRESVKKYLLY